MRINRFYCKERLVAKKSFFVDKAATHYIKNVLRHKTGDPLIVFNPDDGEFSGTISKIAKSSVQITLSEKLRENESPILSIHLGQGIARGEKMDYIIQKATELGVTEITPLFTEHGNVKLTEERLEKRTRHWQYVAINAAEQCGRISIPEIHTAQKLINWLPEREEDLKVVCHPTEHAIAPEQPPKSSVILIGPEGGLSDHERSLAKQVGFEYFGLGPRILRTETASLVAISLLQHEFGDI